MRTHCKRGHELTPENTYTNGKRKFCRACHHIRYAKNGDKQRAAAKAWQAAHPEAKYRQSRKQGLLKLGWTPEIYDVVLAAQNGACAICKQPCKTGKKLAADHAHSSMKRRGLLCQTCNIGIGQFKDNSFLLEAAAAYLRKYED